ncbi:V-type ATPase subunit [Streptococcus caprae]|uniref:V-type ATPase subunit n=1 Tax=Streptococcus caprae TaxID=1640501 RepID=A0ABV8CUN6_9STRE
MDSTLFSQINTTISVRESRLLTPEQFQALLQAKDNDACAQVLQGTVYQLEAQDLSDLNKIETALMKQLFHDYKWAVQEAPVKEVVQLFSLRYTYHNLKVLLKAKAREASLNHLLIPIGAYSLEALEHLVVTLSDDMVPSFMQEEVLATWNEFQDYHDVRVIEIGMDLAYFKHLKRLLDVLDEPEFEQLVTLMIDFYNMTTVKRGLDQGKPRSFIYQLVSDEGTQNGKGYRKLIENTELASWFNQVNPDSFAMDLKTYEEAMAAGTITSAQLEYLHDVLIFKLLDQARYQADSPLALARYLFGKELEVKNLRLILAGRDNNLSEEQITERMRPIYGQ